MPSESEPTMAPSLFAGASETVVSGGTFNAVGGKQHIYTYISQSDDGKKFLASLKPVDRGGYFVSPCMEGTRQSVFDIIDQWLKDTNPILFNIGQWLGCPGCVIIETCVNRLT